MSAMSSSGLIARILVTTFASATAASVAAPASAGDPQTFVVAQAQPQTKETEEEAKKRGRGGQGQGQGQGQGRGQGQGQGQGQRQGQPQLQGVPPPKATTRQLPPATSTPPPVVQPRVVNPTVKDPRLERNERRLQELEQLRRKREQGGAPPAPTTPPPIVKQNPPPGTPPAVLKQVLPPPPATPPPVVRQKSLPPPPPVVNQNTLPPPPQQQGGRSRNRDSDRDAIRGSTAGRRDDNRTDRPIFRRSDDDRRVRRDGARGLDAIKGSRSETVEAGGRRTVIKEGDNRVIVRENNRIFIQNNPNRRFERYSRDATQRRLRDGSRLSIVRRPGGIEIHTITDRDGRLVRRFRRDASGREYTIVDNRRRDRFGRPIAIGIGIGLGALIARSIIDVPPPRLRIPREKYIVEYDRASDDDLYEVLSAPPVDDIDRQYTLDEVLHSRGLRDRMRRIDHSSINFEFGSWEVAEDQVGKLERIARAMLRVIDLNPAESFLVEGHTDAVGSDIDNLTLSDRRAEAVAEILTEEFGVPPENLTTQGYGEQYLKVETEGPERLNRRVAFLRLTPLLSRRGDRDDR